MIAGLPPGAAAWWALVNALILFIAWVLTKLGINICRGMVFNTVGGRAAVVILFVHLADTDEGVVSQSVFLTNIFFDPFVRFLRWSNGLLTNHRRNSRVPASVFYTARLPRYLIDELYPFTMLLITVGLVGANAARTAIFDGPVIFKTHRTCMLLQNGVRWRLPACAVILVLMHLVVGDPQLRCFVLPIIKAWCYWGGVGNLAPSLSPNLFKAFLGVAKRVRPLVKQLDAEYKAKNVLRAYELKEQLAAELARCDPYLARAYDGEAQRGLLKTVRDDLILHKSQCKVFWKRCCNLEGPFYLIVAGGATEFEPSKPMPDLLVLGAVVRPEEVALSRYHTDVVLRADNVIRALRSPLTRMMVCFLRDNHPEGTLDYFFEVETPAKIVSMVKVSLESPAVFGGRLIKCVAIPLNETTGQPDFTKAFWSKREGAHALHVSPPVEDLYASAIDIEDEPPPAAAELWTRVEALRREDADSVAALVASINSHKQAVADRLEASRTDGRGQPLLVVAYFSREANRDVSRLPEPQKAEVLRLRFRAFDAMELALADQGVEVIVVRDNTVTMGALGNCAMAVVPDGTIFGERVDGNVLSDTVKSLAARGLLFTESGIMRFVENPYLLNDLYDKRVDPDRVYVYVDEASREAVRSVGTAENLPRRNLPKTRGNSSLVKFNSKAVVVDGDGVQRPRFRSAAAEQAERTAARRAKKEEPLHALSGTEKRGHGVGRKAARPRRNFKEELLDEKGFPIWSKARLLADEWRAQVVIFDEQKKRGEPYDVDWGGRAGNIAGDLNDITGYGFPTEPSQRPGSRGKMLHGGELMRYYVKCLDDDIKKNA